MSNIELKVVYAQFPLQMIMPQDKQKRKDIDNNQYINMIKCL